MKARDVFLVPDGRLRPTWRALLFVPVFLGLLSVFSTVAVLLAGMERVLSNFELSLLLNGLTAAPSAALTACLFLPLLDRRSLRTLGLWFYEGWGREVGLGLAGGVVLISLVVGLQVLLGQVEFHAVDVSVPGAVMGFGWNLLLLLPAATFEELVFRGYPFQRLVEGLGSFAAVFFLSVLFGLAHLQNLAATPLSTANTVLVGILLALSYLKTRGLWLPIGFHFAWNFWLGFVLSLPVSGIDLSKQLFSVQVGELRWLSGGSYGPEGSLITTVVILSASIWLARTRRLRVSPSLAKELE